MNVIIPVQHQVILDNISKSQQVGGRVAIHDLYKTCLLIFHGNEAKTDGYGVWKFENDAFHIVAVTNLTNGVYVQLANDKTSGGSILMTVGKKFSVEIDDPVTSSRNTKMFF